MMIAEWLQAKKQELEEYLETLEPSKKLDAKCKTENHFTLSINLEYIKAMKISKENDVLLMDWINQRKNIQMGVIYKILEACDDVRRCEIIGIVNPKNENAFKKKLQTLNKAKQQISILEKTPLIPLISIQSPATTLKILEDFLRNGCYLTLNQDDLNVIREFVLRGYAKEYMQTDKDENKTYTYKIRSEDKTTQRHIRKSKELNMRIMHKETYNFVRENDDPQIVYLEPFKLLNDL
ncbi:MAG: hypothetical protein KU29_08510 [Sulfurovum sp. FS06-10]|nr:MAG: hypothetical protein KU29_08510 [Sulfurovum sp. FS06-10]